MGVLKILQLVVSESRVRNEELVAEETLWYYSPKNHIRIFKGYVGRVSTGRPSSGTGFVHRAERVVEQAVASIDKNCPLVFEQLENERVSGCLSVNVHFTDITTPFK